MTREELDEQLDRSVSAFSNVPHVSDELAELLVSQGFFSFDDLSVIEPDQLQELSGLTPEQCDEIVAYADVESEREEREAAQRKHDARAARAAAADKEDAPEEADGPADEVASDAAAAAVEEAASAADAEAASDEEAPGEDESTSVPELETPDALPESAATGGAAAAASDAGSAEQPSGEERSALGSDNGAETGSHPDAEQSAATADLPEPMRPG
jgi:N utilization substance protein A